jgi:AcrR family transcriptional regulator
MTASSIVDTRQRLIDCAIEILDSEGLAGLGLREVARRAGVSHNAPSRHFPGGYRDLCSAVATVGFAGLAGALEAGTNGAGTEPMARLAANGRAYIEFGVAHHGLFELMWRRDLIDFADPDLIVAASAAYASLRNCVLDAQSAGWNPDSDPDLLAATAWSWAQGVTNLWSQGALPGPIGSVDLDVVIRQGLLAFAITH